MSDDKLNGTVREITPPPGDDEKRWPQAEPVFGHVYGFVDPAYGGGMVATTQETWQQIVRDITTMKQRLDALTMENIELKRGHHPDAPRIVLPN